ncbi:Sec-independent protein translocase subunit TatA/TatB [Halpernia frigidisoli]|uniref:Sec-independent protein translocase protein TatA n=1 Tax=Halpernia frigidisoli TaxID=1125876 RepID=A0A1I3GFB1_9FLAO|nr:twin-arginine translocase TatA/TatE family subunit [Halpernia frigidisoli]SFI22133.1 sec-independent protein translocase protein TatA [Halpernia frigidisoli]
MITITILALSWEHIVVIGLILVLLFGGKKIPELMRGMGSGIKEFKDAVKKEDEVPTPQNPTSNHVNNPVNNPVTTPVNHTTENTGNSI